MKRKEVTLVFKPLDRSKLIDKKQYLFINKYYGFIKGTYHIMSQLDDVIFENGHWALLDSMYEETIAYAEIDVTIKDVEMALGLRTAEHYRDEEMEMNK